MATGKQAFGVLAVAWATTTIIVWGLTQWGGINPPEYVSNALATILAALFIYLAPFLPKRTPAS